MIASLLEKIPINVGPAFLKAGLVPIVLGWLLVTIAQGNIREDFDTLILSIDNFQLSPIIYQAFIVFGLAIVLLALREYIFLFAQQIPLWILNPLRAQLLNYQLKKKLVIEKEIRAIKFNYRISEWPFENFYEPKNQPHGIGSDENWLSFSSEARNSLKKLAHKWNETSIISSKYQISIIKGLSEFYKRIWETKQTEESGEEKNIRQEKVKWRNLIHGQLEKEINEIFQQISGGYLRLYNNYRSRKENYPETTFIMPTLFGNIMATLDDYGESVYGIQTSILWSMILNLLEDNEKETISRQKLDIQMYLNMSLVIGISIMIVLFLGLIGSVKSLLLLFSKENWTEFVAGNINVFENELWVINIPLISITFLSPTLLVLSQKLTISSAQIFREQVIVLINLKKTDVLTKLGIHVKSSTREFEVFKKLNDSIMAKKPLLGIKYEE